MSGFVSSADAKRRSNCGLDRCQQPDMDTAIEVADQGAAAAEDRAEDIESVARPLPGDLLIVDAAKPPQPSRVVSRAEVGGGQGGAGGGFGGSSGTPKAGLVTAQAE
jgi:hypothetical protein